MADHQAKPWMERLSWVNPFMSLFIFFACPKKTNQKKRHPTSRFILRVSETVGAFGTRSCPCHDLKQPKSLFVRFFDARRVTMGNVSGEVGFDGNDFM